MQMTPPRLVNFLNLHIVPLFAESLNHILHDIYDELMIQKPSCLIQNSSSSFSEPHMASTSTPISKEKRFGHISGQFSNQISNMSQQMANQASNEDGMNFLK